MQDIKQKIVENKATIGIVAGTVVLVIILAVLLGKGGFSGNSENQLANVSEVLDIASSTEEVSAAMAASALAAKIQYPVLADPDMFDYSGQQNSCGDEIVWVRTSVPQPQFVWRATLEAMKNADMNLGFLPGNPLAEQKNAAIEKAVIENGIAKAYLNGELKLDTEDDCASDRLISQIVAAGKQFGNVKSVQVYLNGELLN
ncbi:MAG TPA: GerMN domain-containing protein [Candidatus Paceibacterota bacterium]|nr:GerMN domain-containing protein [Candidatus Paceibacterota bacterium]HRZ34636.1 GerMN domain-containing protein [Candidatus Paceibacterota bacterium]